MPYSLLAGNSSTTSLHNSHATLKFVTYSDPPPILTSHEVCDDHIHKIVLTVPPSSCLIDH